MALFFFTSVFQLNSSLIRTRAREGKALVDAPKAASFRWHPLLFQILAFGQLPSAVDVLLLRFLTDDQLAKIKDGEETELFRILDLATEIDPAFLSLYTAGSTFLTIVRNDNRGALKLLLKGEKFLETRLDSYPETFKEKHWPLRWRINFLLGYLYLFELSDLQKSMASYHKMALYPGLPEAQKLRTERVLTVPGQVKFARGSIAVLRRQSEDDPRVLAELDEREKIVIENERLWRWNQDFSAATKKRPRGKSIADLFSDFRRANSIPESDSIGGKIFLNPEGQIDSTTKKIITREAIMGAIEKPEAGG